MPKLLTESRTFLVLAAASVLLVSACRSFARDPLPPRTAAVSLESNLRAKLSNFAADSMEGRAAGTRGQERAVRFLEAEVTRLGLTPAGDGGTFRQTFFMRFRRLDPESNLQVGDRVLRPTVDFRAVTYGRGSLRPIDGAEVVFGGIVGDPSTQIAPALAADRVVVLGVPVTMNASRAFQNVIYGPNSRFGRARAVVIASLDFLPDAQRQISASVSLADTAETLANSQPATLLVTANAASAMLGIPLSTAIAGSLGRTIHGRLTVIDEVRPSHNIVAVLRGSDPKLRGEFIVVGAHSDHLPMASRALEHDSVRAAAIDRSRLRAAVARGPQPSTAGTGGGARHAAARLDSIYNGADDNGSGSVALLEIARAMTSAPHRPRRSLLFVWHAAEEDVFMGSEWFSDHPPVPTDSMLAMVNLDMVGRGGADDIAGGGPRYLQVIGSDRRSPALLKVITDLNAASATPATLVTTDPDGGFCKSDQWSYARRGIPVAFFTTGSHADYHSVTDETVYIDFAKLASVTRFVTAVVARLADTQERLEPPGKRVVLPGFCGG